MKLADLVVMYDIDPTEETINLDLVAAFWPCDDGEHVTIELAGAKRWKVIAMSPEEFRLLMTS